MMLEGGASAIGGFAGTGGREARAATAPGSISVETSNPRVMAARAGRGEPEEWLAAAVTADPHLESHFPAAH